MVLEIPSPTSATVQIPLHPKLCAVRPAHANPDLCYNGYLGMCWEDHAYLLLPNTGVPKPNKGPCSGFGDLRAVDWKYSSFDRDCDKDPNPRESHGKGFLHQVIRVRSRRIIEFSAVVHFELNLSLPYLLTSSISCLTNTECGT